MCLRNADALDLSTWIKSAGQWMEEAWEKCGPLPVDNPSKDPT